MRNSCFHENLELWKKVTAGVRGLLLTVRWLGFGLGGGCIAVWSNGPNVGSSSPALFENPSLVKLQSQFHLLVFSFIFYSWLWVRCRFFSAPWNRSITVRQARRSVRFVTNQSKDLLPRSRRIRFLSFVQSREWQKPDAFCPPTVYDDCKLNGCSLRSAFWEWQGYGRLTA